MELERGEIINYFSVLVLFLTVLTLTFMLIFMKLVLTMMLILVHDVLVLVIRCCCPLMLTMFVVTIRHWRMAQALA